jgi:hypothetical protein
LEILLYVVEANHPMLADYDDDYDYNDGNWDKKMSGPEIED